MNWFPECGPCFLRQALMLQKLLGLSDEVSKRLIRKISCLLCSIKDQISPPEFAIDVYAEIKRQLQLDDPYRELKEESNKLALQMESTIKEKIHKAQDPVKEAVLLSIAGNIIDFGVAQEIDVLAEINRIVREERLADPFLFQIDDFLFQLKSSQRILIIGDNCGEVVFDKLLMETIKEKWPDKEFVFAVRGGPIINDVTYSEALAVSISSVAKIVSTGVAAPGAVLNRCSEEFRREFYAANMVVSKGQGNFEALSDVDRDVFFLFMAKCDVVARFVGCPKGSILLLRKN